MQATPEDRVTRSQVAMDKETTEIRNNKAPAKALDLIKECAAERAKKEKHGTFSPASILSPIKTATSSSSSNSSSSQYANEESFVDYIEESYEDGEIVSEEATCCWDDQREDRITQAANNKEAHE